MIFQTIIGVKLLVHAIMLAFSSAHKLGYDISNYYWRKLIGACHHASFQQRSQIRVTWGKAAPLRETAILYMMGSR